MSEPWPEPAVVMLATPPVRRSTTVRAGIDRTFDVFVRDLGAWWPLDPYSLGGSARVRDLRVEQRVGGRVEEVWDDGTTRTWGELAAWDPPHGFTMSWLVTPVATEVELTFRALGPGLTRVDVEHRGWERLSAEQLTASSIDPDGYVGGSYHRGWGVILGELARHVEG